MPTAPKSFRLNDAATHEQRRANSHQRGYTRRWSKARKIFLTEHPFCVLCEADGYSVPATVVDHKIPHRSNNDELFWNEDNWQPLCKTCHDLKTAKGL